MRRARAERVLDLFERAAELPEAEQQAFLDASCEGDNGVRDRVDAMLQADREGAPDLEPGVTVRMFPKFDAKNPRPTRIAGYRILDVLGEGGMSTVFRAMQEKPRREVALKILRPALATDSAIRRFELETEILGKLEHDAIARIYDAGIAEIETLHNVVQQPFLSMELVRGSTIIEYATERELDTTQRITLLAEVCDAVSYIHDRGIVHRDLKPANVLVDDRGHPRIVDFGVARLNRDGSMQSTMHTIRGQLMGTLAYMAPEQIQSDPQDLDHRCDVYALGVLGFELLTGGLPIPIVEGSATETVARVLHTAPRRLEQFDRNLRGDVATVIHTALAKDRSARYASTTELGADLRAHLAGRPIQARPPHWHYVLGCFVRRHRIAMAIAATVLLIGLASIWLTLPNEDERRGAYRTAIAAATTADALRDREAMRQHLDAAAAALGRDQLGWEWFHLDTRIQPAHSVIEAPQPVTTARFEGEHIVATTTAGGTITFTRDGHVVGTSADPDPKAQPARYRTADGHFELSSSAKGDYGIIDTKTGLSHRLSLQRESGTLHDAAFSPDGQRLVIGFTDGRLRLYSTSEGELLGVGNTQTNSRVSVAFAEKCIVSASEGQSLTVWDPYYLRQIGSTYAKDVGHVGASPFSVDGKYIVTGNHPSRPTNRLVVFDRAMIDAERNWHRIGAPVCRIAVSDRFIVAAKENATISILDRTTGLFVAAEAVAGPASAPPSAIAIGPGSEPEIVMVSDGELWIWRLQRGRLDEVAHTHTSCRRLIRLRSGEILVRNDATGVEVFAPATQQRRRIGGAKLVQQLGGEPLVDGPLETRRLANGTILLWKLRGTTLRILDGVTRKTRRTVAVGFPILALAVSPDGRRIAIGGDDDSVHLWDPFDWRVVTQLETPDAGITALAWSPDGGELYAGTALRTMRSWKAW